VAEKTLDTALSAGFTSLARKVFRMQKAEKRVSDAWIEGPDAGYPGLVMFPPEWGPGGKTVASITFSDGSSAEFHPPRGERTGDPELEPSSDRLSG
jgi:hypothetical protein